MRRGGPLRRASMKRTASRRRPGPTKLQQRSDYQSDALWRGEVMAAGGWRCASCGESRVPMLEADHMVPRSQGGRSDVANGLVLCGEFGRGRCHPRKTAGELKIERTWLRPEQITYLAEAGWVEWERVEDSQFSPWHGREVPTTTFEPTGLGWKHFAAYA